ncbi:hypothetical protein WKI68_41700 [Streptomyces sp. MS1.HAVA.3]|uniref:Uncharacterized protein n=1 Tax=Streptomyces caledonius TaxID=3134107 RepID=A0ABU8UDJ7_9ACTN
MSRSAASGGQLDELAAFALEHVCDAPADGGGAGIGAVFLFADDIKARYLYTFADLAEAREHLADPAYGYLRCAVSWQPAPDVFAVQAQEIGSATSFLLTRRRVADGPADEVVRTEGAQALLPPSGPTAKVTTEVEATAEAEAADPAGLEELEELEYGLERAVDLGEGMAEADDRLRRWIGRAGRATWWPSRSGCSAAFPTWGERPGGRPSPGRGRRRDLGTGTLRGHVPRRRCSDRPRRGPRHMGQGRPAGARDPGDHGGRGRWDGRGTSGQRRTPGLGPDLGPVRGVGTPAT